MRKQRRDARHHKFRVGAIVVIHRRVVRDPNQLGIRNVAHVSRKSQTARSHVRRDQVIEPRLAHRQLTLRQRGDVLIDADDVVSCLRDARSRHGSEMPQAGDRDLHGHRDRCRRIP